MTEEQSLIDRLRCTIPTEASQQSRLTFQQRAMLDAAVEIKRLQGQTLQKDEEIESLRLAYQQAMTELSRVVEEIERLRAAGDALAAGIRTGRWDNTLDAWEDIRRG
jgi:hypothetical protein